MNRINWIKLDKMDELDILDKTRSNLIKLDKSRITITG
jgi:hypothetical protein